MFERLLDYMVGEPRRLIGLGKLLAQAGSFLVVAGFAGKAATTVVSIARGWTTRTRPDVSLAEVFPGYLNWWMPETLVGFGFAALLIFAGLAAARAGRDFERLLRY